MPLTFLKRQSEDIHAIGSPDFKVIYVGRSKDMRCRLQRHKYQNKAIDNFVKYQFALNGGMNLYIKWVEVENSKCLERGYLNCMSGKPCYM